MRSYYNKRIYILEKGDFMDDRKLLNILEKDARLSTHDIALMLNETEEAVALRMKELEEARVIAGYHAVVNYEQYDSNEEVEALIEVNSVPEREKGYDRVAMMIANYPEVKSLQLISGHSEFMVLVRGKNMLEISNFVAQKLAPIDGVKGTSTIFVLKNYKRDGVILNPSKEKQQERLMGIL